MKQKPLKHAAIRFFKACIKTNNHFLHRHLTKNDLVLPLIELLEGEGPRDNLLSSSCLDVFEVIRKVSGAVLHAGLYRSSVLTLRRLQDNVKSIINHIFEKHEAKISKLTALPNLKMVMGALRTRWEQNNEPTPVETLQSRETANALRQVMESNDDDYFNETDDEAPIGPQPPTSASSPSSSSGHKRKRAKNQQTTSGETRPRKVAATQSGGSLRSLNLEYGDESDSDSERSGSEKDGQVAGPKSPAPGLAPSPLPAQEGSASPSTPRIKLKISKGLASPSTSTVALSTTTSSDEPSPKPAADSELGEMAMQMAQKRAREEEDEDSSGLASLMSGGRPGTPRTNKTMMDSKSGNGSGTPSKDRFSGIGSAVKDAGKKIKLNLGFTKKTGTGDKEEPGS